MFFFLFFFLFVLLLVLLFVLLLLPQQQRPPQTPLHPLNDLPCRHRHCRRCSLCRRHLIITTTFLPLSLIVIVSPRLSNQPPQHPDHLRHLPNDPANPQVILNAFFGEFLVDQEIELSCAPEFNEVVEGADLYL